MKITNNVLTQVKSDKAEKDKITKIKKIKNTVLVSLKKSKSSKEFYKNVENKLKELEKIDAIQRHKLDISIRDFVYIYKPEWKSELRRFRNPHPNKKRSLSELVYYTSDERPKINNSFDEEFKIFYEKDYLNIYLNLSNDFRSKSKKEHIQKIIKHLKSNSNVYYYVNYICFSLTRFFNNLIDYEEKQSKKLKEDRIYLYELSLKVTDETKFKVIVSLINKGRLELSKLVEVKKYMLKTIPDKKIKKSKNTQVLNHLYTLLKKKHTRSNIQRTIFKNK